MPHNILAIVNPVSGRRSRLPLVQQVARLIASQGGRMVIRETERAGHATEIATGADPEVDAVLAVGGDGTVSEVVNGLLGTSVPLAILGTGTENLLACELAMPVDAEGTARLLRNGQPSAVDVGVVNGRRFLMVAGAGFDAECVERISEVRDGNITRWDYFRPTWDTFWHHRFPTLIVEVDGDVVFEDRGFVLVGLIRRYGGGFRILERAKLDDGLLDVCILPCACRRRLLVHALRVALHRHIGRGGVIYRQGNRVRVSSPQSVPLEVDGDAFGKLPAKFSIQAGGVKFLRMKVTNGDPVPKKNR